MRRPPRPLNLRLADRLVARSILLLLLGLYTATMTGLPDIADSEVEFQTTRSLARFEGLAISEETPEGAAIVAAGFNHKRGVDGKPYSWFGVGQALVGVPFYWAGDGLARLDPELEERHADSPPRYGVPRSEYWAHLLVGWRNPLLAALTAWLLVLSARRIGASRRAAWLAGLGYGVATYAWPQARSTLSDVQATFLLFAAFHLALRLREGFARLEPPSRTTLVAVGALLALAVWTRVVAAPAVLLLAVAAGAVVVVGRRRMWSLPNPRGRAGAWPAARDVAWLLAPAAVGAAGLLWLNARRFGDPFETGYGDAVLSGTFFNYPPLLGLAGVLVSPGCGLLWLAPLVLLAPLGVWRARGDRLLTGTVLAVTLAVFAPVVVTATWHGAWTYGPRYVLPALPFLFLLVALGLDQVRRKRFGPAVVAVLLGLGLATSLPGVLVDQSTHKDLALQGARDAWPDIGGDAIAVDDERQRDEARFLAIQWDPRFAAPWAHWRILRHRLAGLPERFDASELFFLESEASYEPTHPRDRGFAHLAWVDLAVRLSRDPWPAIVFALACLGAAALAAVRGLDPTRP